MVKSKNRKAVKEAIHSQGVNIGKDVINDRRKAIVISPAKIVFDNSVAHAFSSGNAPVALVKASGNLVAVAFSYRTIALEKI